MSCPKEVRANISELIKRMAPYFPFHAPSAPSPTGVTPSTELNLVHANLVILLAPPMPNLQMAKSSRREIGWRERIKAIEECWTVMRDSDSREKGKRKIDKWAMDEVADWIVDLLVNLLYCYSNHRSLTSGTIEGHIIPLVDSHIVLGDITDCLVSSYPAAWNWGG